MQYKELLPTGETHLDLEIFRVLNRIKAGTVAEIKEPLGYSFITVKVRLDQLVAAGVLKALVRGPEKEKVYWKVF